ncbi:hypothetical protein GALL_414200 [mine drainage metagenome]|uniref:Uncharacterized protein n=1 Tax=mine drainage metagenome TaxID=410659 RepID=A0A1J5QA80_9ZZZZ
MPGDERRGVEVRTAEVPRREHRTAEQDPTLGVEVDADPVQRATVVHAAAARLGHPVGRDGPDPGLAGAGEQCRRRRGAAEKNGVERPERAHAVGVVEQSDELGGHERGVAPFPGHRRSGRGERRGTEPALEVHHGRNGPGEHGADDDLHAGHVHRRQREKPLGAPIGGAPDGVGGGLGGRVQRPGPEHDRATRTGRAGGVEDDGDVVGHLGARDRRGTSGGIRRGDRGSVPRERRVQEREQVERPARRHRCGDQQATHRSSLGRDVEWL